MKTKVSIVKCKTYAPEELKLSVKKSFDLLGGLAIFIKKGQRILIKPNILSARPPEDGVCTHIELIRAVTRLVKDYGAVPVIGDNPGGSISAGKAYEGSGVKALAEEEGIELLAVKNVKIVNNIPIASYVFECDRIISLPKMKTHVLMGLTGAVKNMYGVSPGLYKTECHKNFPTPEEFSKVLVDVFELSRPHLVLMDGITAMDKEGPSSGRLRNTGLLIASEDSVALDSVFASLIGIKPLDIFTTKEAYIRKLGEANLENIEIMGEKIEENLIKDFEMPGHKALLNTLGPIAKLIALFIKFGPSINEKLCKKCNICAQTCPVSVITISADKSIIDPKKCIKCMCCHEVCPYRAVELRRNILARAFGL